MMFTLLWTSFNSKFIEKNNLFFSNFSNINIFPPQLHICTFRIFICLGRFSVYHFFTLFFPWLHFLSSMRVLKQRKLCRMSMVIPSYTHLLKGGIYCAFCLRIVRNAHVCFMISNIWCSFVSYLALSRVGNKLL